MFDAPTPPPQASPPLAPTVPPKRRPNPFTWRLLADVVAFATAVISLMVAIFAGSSRDQAQDEAASLSDQIASLDAEISSLSDERDQLQEELAVTEEPGDGDGSTPAADEGLSGSYLTLEDAVATQECRGEWEPTGLQVAGEEYFDAFVCSMTVMSSSSVYTGYVDFLVPEGAERITGLAGFDERSEDDTMVVRYTIAEVPDGEPSMSVNVPYGGEGERFDVDITGMSRIRLQVENLSSDHSNSEANAKVGWAEVKFE